MKKILIALICVLLSLSICQAENKTITGAADPWPPFIDPDHPKQGISIEVATAAFASQGYTYTHKIMPWARAENAVKTGKIDILPNTWHTDKRTGYLKYSEPYASNEVKFIKKKGDDFEYNGMASLAGKKIGIILSYGYGDEFMNSKDFKREAVSDFMTNIKKLVAGRIDLSLGDEIVAKNKISKNDPALLDEIEFTKNYMSSNDLYVTCGLKNPRHEEIINAFNKGLETIKSNGTLDAIFKSYGIE
ncbi:MAG TPA: amino acid ABC transporter substrate-binding protein [Desulfobacteraceae bacterium]|nr:amino acid ABC transporter substrate-binding protein [Desulfobacteraceae bacterium]|tara:strand:- start:1353 stop:2093 length:741 start_codon:yes stop_codon:yes gene_type:complete